MSHSEPKAVRPAGRGLGACLQECLRPLCLMASQSQAWRNQSERPKSKRKGEEKGHALGWAGTGGDDISREISLLCFIIRLSLPSRRGLPPSFFVRNGVSRNHCQAHDREDAKSRTARVSETLAARKETSGKAQ